MVFLYTTKITTNPDIFLYIKLQKFDGTVASSNINELGNIKRIAKLQWIQKTNHFTI